MELANAIDDLDQRCTRLEEDYKHLLANYRQAVRELQTLRSGGNYYDK